MKSRTPIRIQGISYNLILIMILLHLIGFLSQSPYPGFSTGKGSSTVVRVFDETQTEKLQPGDTLVSVNGILSSDYLNSLDLQYWKDVSPGDDIPITISRNGEQRQISWIYPGQTKAEFFDRYFSPIWIALLLWGFGITAHLSLPNEKNRGLILAYNFLIAIGFIAYFGPSDYHIWYSAYLVRFCQWTIIPLLILLPWHFPSPMVEFRSKKLRVVLTIIGVMALLIGLILDIRQPSLGLNYFGLMTGLAAGIVLLILRFYLKKETRDSLKLFFVFTLVSYLISFAYVLLTLVDVFLPNFVEAILFFGFLLTPFSILYTIWSGKLPKYQFRPNRYLPMALFSTLIILILMMVLMAIENIEEQLNTALILLAAVIIAISTIQIYPYFNRLIDRYIFRIPISSNDLLRSFSKHLDRTKDTASISSLMGNLILPNLLVRQSVLIEFQTPNHIRLLDQVGVHDRQIPSTVQIHQLIKLNSQVIPPQTIRSFPQEMHWIRVILPLVFDDQLIGVWLLGQRDPNDLYNEYVVDILQALAQQTTIALIHHRKSQRLTTLYKANIDRDEEERAQLARDLHDDTLNDLALLQRETNDPVLSDGITKIINSLRKTISGLRPEMLSYGLVTALTDLADTLNERQDQTTVAVQLDGEPIPISPSVEQHLYRIIQQACENALRHAGASHIRILGIITEKAVHLTVIDDGAGFDVDTTLDFTDLIANQHYGLAGMHERADLIDATLTIQSNSDQGTRISIYWENPQGK